jgi:hypothetical protein
MYCGGDHLGFPIDIKNTNFVEDLPMIIPGQFGFNCPSVTYCYHVFIHVGNVTVLKYQSLGKGQIYGVL